MINIYEECNKRLSLLHSFFALGGGVSPLKFCYAVNKEKGFYR